MQRLCTKLYFDNNFIAIIPVPSHDKMLGGSEEKKLYHKWILTDKISMNIQKKIEFSLRIRIQHGPDKQDS